MFLITKVFVCTLSFVVRLYGDIAIATATSGIAATLLKGGRTAQGRFKIGIKHFKGCTMNISWQHDLAVLFRMAKLIIWDEATMAHKHLIEALDIGLRDLTGSYVSMS